MHAALDVHYEKDRSIAACVMFEHRSDNEPTGLVLAVGPRPSQYYPGRFYERELSCLLTVLKHADREFETIIIDSYVHLRAEVGKGLGTHLREKLSYSPVVIGVAKSPLKVADHFMAVTRGRSTRPLFVSAIGCPVEEAARWVVSMHGPYRIPTLLRLADQHARRGGVP